METPAVQDCCWVDGGMVLEGGEAVSRDSWGGEGTKVKSSLQHPGNPFAPTHRREPRLHLRAAYEVCEEVEQSAHHRGGLASHDGTRDLQRGAHRTKQVTEK